MKAAFGAWVIVAFACLRAPAQVRPSIELLSPGDEGFDGIPEHTRCVDVYVNAATTDVWTAAGIRVLTENGGMLRFADGDTNTPGEQPALINPGLANRFVTSISKPRLRNGAARFQNAGAAVAGAYDPTGQFPIITPGELNVAYFASPPESAGSPSVDGYIARIAVDISGTGLPSGYSGWGASIISAIPSGATVVLRSTGIDQPDGTVVVGFDPILIGINWALWWIPEPATTVIAILLAIQFRRERRSPSR